MPIVPSYCCFAATGSTCGAEPGCSCFTVGGTVAVLSVSISFYCGPGAQDFTAWVISTGSTGPGRPWSRYQLARTCRSCAPSPQAIGPESGAGHRRRLFLAAPRAGAATIPEGRVIPGWLPWAIPISGRWCAGKRPFLVGLRAFLPPEVRSATRREARRRRNTFRLSPDGIFSQSTAVPDGIHCDDSRCDLPENARIIAGLRRGSGLHLCAAQDSQWAARPRTRLLASRC